MLNSYYSMLNLLNQAKRDFDKQLKKRWQNAKVSLRQIRFNQNKGLWGSGVELCHKILDKGGQLCKSILPGPKRGLLLNSFARYEFANNWQDVSCFTDIMSDKDIAFLSLKSCGVSDPKVILALAQESMQQKITSRLQDDILGNNGNNKLFLQKISHDIAICDLVLSNYELEDLTQKEKNIAAHKLDGFRALDGVHYSMTERGDERGRQIHISFMDMEA